MKTAVCGGIGCILMASGLSVRYGKNGTAFGPDMRGTGLSVRYGKNGIAFGTDMRGTVLSARYGKNKLLEKLDGREIILHAAGSLTEAGLEPLAVTRSQRVRELLDREGIACIVHDGAKKSDTMRAGLENLAPDLEGYLFMPADQPLVLPSSLRKLTGQFESCPGRAVRLGFGDTAGSPVLFPAFCREELLAYRGDRGGAEVLRKTGLPCGVVQAAFAWELWDVDTPEDMERVKRAYFRYRPHRDR